MKIRWYVILSEVIATLALLGVGYQQPVARCAVVMGFAGVLALIGIENAINEKA